MTQTSALDTQVDGSHYKDMAIQPMEFSMANKLDACQHTIVKYVTRFRAKGGIRDLEKAKHVIDMLIEFEQDELAPEPESEFGDDIDESATDCQCPICQKARNEEVRSWVDKMVGAKPKAIPTQTEVAAAVNVLLDAGVISVVKDGDA